MADWHFHLMGRGLAVALCAAAISLAHAQPRAAPVSFRAPGDGLTFGVSAPPKDHARSARVYQTASRLSPGQHRVRTAHAYRARRTRSHLSIGRGAGAIPYRPIGERRRSGQRLPGDAAYLRAGSIREAVTRYNEERVMSMPAPRPASPGQRLPDPSLYRN